MTLRELADRIAERWADEGMGTANVVEHAGYCDVRLFDEIEDEYYVGNYADPGLTICELTEFKDVTLVKVNNIWMQALPKHIVGWAIGYSG